MINTFSSAIVSFTVVLLALGIIVGLTLGQSELVNPFSSYSQLGRDQVETEYLEQQRQIDIQFYAQSKQAELDAQIEQQKQALIWAEERHQHELAQAAQRNQIVNSLVGFAWVAIPLAVLFGSMGGAYYLVCMGRARAMLNRTMGNTSQPSPNPYTALRMAARQREREERQQQIDSQKRLQELFAWPICPTDPNQGYQLPVELAVTRSEYGNK
jgi:hypothetical protein